MTDTTVILVAAIPAGFAAIASMCGAILGFINSQAIRRQEIHLNETKAAMVTLEKNTNSMKDALVKVVGESEFAKGKLEGAADSALPAAILRQESEHK